jgi:hypothetical protein
MRKQARRLWLGDWQRGGEDQTDKVTILPVDDEAGEPVGDEAGRAPAKQRRKVSRGAAAVAAAAILFVLALALLARSGNDQVTSAQSQAPPAPTPQPQARGPQSQVPQGAAPQGFGGPDLTGPAAVKAAKAALAKFPGDVERVTAGTAGSGYVVHVFLPGGCEVHVVVSGQFKILGSDAGGASGCGGFAPQPQGGSANQS